MDSLDVLEMSPGFDPLKASRSLGRLSRFLIGFPLNDSNWHARVDSNH